jgi:hypothetical protein
LCPACTVRKDVFIILIDRNPQRSLKAEFATGTETEENTDPSVP